MSKTRSIFEEVGDRPAGTPAPAAAVRRPTDRRGIALWLAILFALIVAMIAVGGMTRLTDSGLSITEWRPVTGAVPPMDEAGWTAEFDKYKATPQAAALNPDMTLPSSSRSTGGSGAIASSAGRSARSGPWGFSGSRCGGASRRAGCRG